MTQPPISGRATLSTIPAGAPVPVGKKSRVYLIDGSGFIFRAFHALPPLTRPSDSLPVGAVHGFCAMLWKLLAETKESERPTHIAVVFDAGPESFRNEIYPGYKAHRPPPPEELVPQFALIREAVKAFNIASVEQEGFEADDLIATYAREAEKAGAHTVIVSSDKDLMQLVGPGIEMLDTIKGRRIGPEDVLEKFGVPPEKVVDVQALAGDSVDNVPGVPGIGVKTAAELIRDYGSLENLLARAAEIRQPKRREKLIEFAEQARLSRALVTLKEDVPEEVPLAALAVRERDPVALLTFLRRMEFNTLTRRISAALGPTAPPGGPDREPQPAAVLAPAAGGAAPGSSASAGTPARAALEREETLKGIPVDRTRYETVTRLEDLTRWIEAAREAGRVAFDTETTSLDPLRAELVGFSLAVAPGKACYIPLNHRLTAGALDFTGGILPQIPAEEALQQLAPLLSDPAVLKIGQNVKFDALVLSRYGLNLTPFDDTLLISYALDAGRGGHGMDDLALRHLGHVCISYEQALAYAPGGKKSEKTFAAVPLDKATEYAAEDADVTLRLWLLLKPRLAAARVTRIYEAIDRPLVPVVIDMERRGVKVNAGVLARLSQEFAAEAAALEKKIFALAGYEFNLASPRQTGELLFDKLGLPGGKRTRTGQWETRAGSLDDLAVREDLPENARKLIDTMLAWRQLSKLRSTYTDALPGHVNPETGRIHTSFALAHTTTGRLASSDPNLQNIPIRTKEGRAIRAAFVADAGMKLISADYSQIELRVLAHIADIPQLRKAFEEGQDIHALTASEIFGVPVAGMPPEVRRRAKAINFGIIYGISPFGLANQLGISREEAGQYIKTYFERFPGIRDYMEETKKKAHEQGYVETLFGRRIHYPEINTKTPSVRGNLERAAINAPIQGAAADIIRRAMAHMPAALAKAGLARTHMLLQVHDELVFEAAEDEAEAALPVIKRTMAEAPLPAAALSVPLVVEAKAADNWEAGH